MNFTDRDKIIIDAAKRLLRFWIDVNVNAEIFTLLQKNDVYVAGGAIAGAINIVKAMGTGNDSEIARSWAIDMPYDIDFFAPSIECKDRLSHTLKTLHSSKIKEVSKEELEEYGNLCEIEIHPNADSQKIITNNAITFKSQDISGMHGIINSYDKNATYDYIGIDVELSANSEDVDFLKNVKRHMRSISKRPDEYLLDYQFITCRCGNIKEVVKSFDTLHSMGAYSMLHKMFLTKATYDAIINKKIVPTSLENSLSPIRVNKFAKRGYNA